MYGLSYLTLRNGTVPQLNWIDGRPNRLIRKGRILAKDGAVDVCLEYPDGSYIPIHSDGSIGWFQETM
jgi:hypothetical protein